MKTPRRDGDLVVNFWTMPFKAWSVGLAGLKATALYWLGLHRYSLDFLEPFFMASKSFSDEESRQLRDPILENVGDYAQLLAFNLMLAGTAWRSSVNKALGYHLREFQRFAFALINTLEGVDGETVDQYMAKEAEALERLIVEFPGPRSVMSKKSTDFISITESIR